MRRAVKIVGFVRRTVKIAPETRRTVALSFQTRDSHPEEVKKLANKDKEAWDKVAKKTQLKPPDGEHWKPCEACDGTGQVWQATLNRETDSVDPCRVTCPACGGTGTAG